MKLQILMVCAALTVYASAAQGVTLQCGNFNLVALPNEMTKVNGETVTSPKNISLGENGIKVEMTLMPASDGNDYGFEYIHPDGKKEHWLNVELIRTNMDQPRLIGTFNCHRVAG
ncbi:hypothetical protein [Pantoea stewartii]|uniref:hypothetical protein n=1 Tax=Pantoea stewartii TaxID=66269 RepID=UPI0037037DA2